MTQKSQSLNIAAPKFCFMRRILSYKTRKFYNEVSEIYNNYSIEEADIISPIGGDGMMLSAIQENWRLNKPFLGINYGRIGFLMNNISSPYNLQETYQKCQSHRFYLLRAKCQNIQGESFEIYATNEISLLRQNAQAAHIRVFLDQQQMTERIIADGLVISTPLGSSAYNFSLGGSIIPYAYNLLSMRAMASCNDILSKGMLLSPAQKIKLEIIAPFTRPVSLSYDNISIPNINYVEIDWTLDYPIDLLFDESWDEKINKIIFRRGK